MLDCHDCRAKPGELHALGCDVEQCPDCGCQTISCRCNYGRDAKPWPFRDNPRLPWTGVWPGEENARELGVTLNDLNALRFRWNPGTAKWEPFR